MNNNENSISQKKINFQKCDENTTTHCSSSLTLFMKINFIDDSIICIVLWQVALSYLNHVERSWCLARREGNKNILIMFTYHFVLRSKNLSPTVPHPHIATPVHTVTCWLCNGLLTNNVWIISWWSSVTAILFTYCACQM